MAANATDQRLAFSQNIGQTYLLNVGTAATQLSDAIGALPPGKYLVQALSLTGTPARCWLRDVPFVKSQASGILVPATAGYDGAGESAVTDAFPLDAAVMMSFTYHVKKGVNDRLEAICVSGAAALLAITRTGE